MADRAYIHGYHAPIYRAVWSRPQTWGIPHQWCMVWAILGVLCGFLSLLRFGRWGVVIAGSVWLFGHLGMQWLTRWDPSWDDIGLAQLTRRYHGYYEAG